MFFYLKLFCFYSVKAINEKKSEVCLFKSIEKDILPSVLPEINSGISHIIDFTLFSLYVIISCSALALLLRSRARAEQLFSILADYKPPTCPLRPVILNNACPPRITAAAGTELAGTLF
jgi:hypothetical protein